MLKDVEIEEFCQTFWGILHKNAWVMFLDVLAKKSIAIAVKIHIQ